MENEKKKDNSPLFKITCFVLSLIIFGFLFFFIMDSKYKKEISWAVYDSGLIVAVEVDNYEGDSIKAGTYSAYVDHVADGKMPDVYDIYILNHNINSKNELGNVEPDYTIGGTDNNPISITVNKGNYIVIQPYDVIYEPSGIFEMKYIKSSN